MQEYLTAWRLYAQFAGRATRREYWLFVLFNAVFAIVIAFLSQWLFGRPTLDYIYNLAVFLPSWAVSVRRLHDTNRSGWWLLLPLIPIVGAIILLIFLLLRGTDPNRFGPRAYTSY
ncbi:MAG: DUF805 domain-containing protein [Sulfobacillus acidophilus]|uniref:DUF805 domain-containing protein n=1 Tax=Sulfobacillus acidophilus TaxID=53633 RepID=A0A2T2WDD4_9FIRM|nr:MAG: DUF805 domain-containing protein [Sulfobacillus acidophilus]